MGTSRQGTGRQPPPGHPQNYFFSGALAGAVSQPHSLHMSSSLLRRSCYVGVICLAPIRRYVDADRRRTSAALTER
ncbi:MAG: hypothetical protein NVS3B26_14900 [Mycobacteriales bacterium]